MSEVRCGKSWHHSIADPCSELDPFFLPCPGCPPRVKQQDRRRVETDGDDAIEVGELLWEIARVAPPDELPREVELSNEGETFTP
jgi:hypothetical protein